MTVKTITVGIAEDAIEQLAKVSLDRAVKELIWNSLMPRRPELRSFSTQTTWRDRESRSVGQRPRDSLRSSRVHLQTNWGLAEENPSAQPKSGSTVPRARRKRTVQGVFAWTLRHLAEPRLGQPSGAPTWPELSSMAKRPIWAEKTR